MTTYPSIDIERSCFNARIYEPKALVVSVDVDSPAYDAGFEPGCYITSVDGMPVRDIIDWRWLTSEDEITLGYIDLDGEEGVVDLWREEGEPWGFEFEGVVFDKVKLCRNACVFCFMHQLPVAMRPSLSMRDDDFRLSFLAGTFVTLTNLTFEDEQRIVEQSISPLRVSLHASNARVRAQLIGKHADKGIAALERLLAHGIQVHAQIVLVPDMNDGNVLEETLDWAYRHDGIENIGIVPLGFTKHQTRFDHSFNDARAACAVIDCVARFQEKALAERGTPWVFVADEFYRNAFGKDVPDKVPPAWFYGNYELYEDGIGIIRSYIDEFNEACECGLMHRVAEELAAAHTHVYMVVGEAMQPFLDDMLERSPLRGYLSALTVKNEFFGGNVDVTGLLCGCDVAKALREHAAHRSSCASSENFPQAQYAVLRVMFNDNAVTLDDMSVEHIEIEAGVPIAVVSCNPLQYLDDIQSLLH